MRSDSFVKEKRIEMNESIRNELGALFNDDISMSIYKELLQAVPWDKPGDFYELKYYPDIEKMYYWDEDYWNSYTFSDSQKETEEATVLDCGAYIGDSVESICELIPQKNIWYYAFEPSPENVAEIYKNECVRSLGDNFKVFACGVGNRNEKQLFESDYTMEGGRFVEEAIEKSYLADLEIHTNTLEIRRLDDLNLEVHGRLYIKMDVEGSELEALKGAENLIKTNRPFLAICLYHRKNDLMQIPLYIKSIVDNYHFYLRGGCHTILWAIPKECE
jgi:FkbM family methyltransferase